MATGRADTNFRNPKDFFGRPLDECKSMLQKGIRRGDMDIALSGFFGCFNMVALFPGNTRAIALQTNAINRLIVCMCEDICFANPFLVKNALPILLEASKNRKARDPKKLANIVGAMVESKKSRWCSHAAAYFKGKKYEGGVNLSKPECFAKLGSEAGWKAVEAEINARCSSRYFGPLMKYHKGAAACNKKNIERFILGMAHFFHVQSDKGAFFRKEWARTDELILTEVDVQPFLKNERFVSVPDYAIDIHTKQGRKLGLGAETFRLIGALVVNESELMAEKEYEEAYLNQ